MLLLEKTVTFFHLAPHAVSGLQARQTQHGVDRTIQGQSPLHARQIRQRVDAKPTQRQIGRLSRTPFHSSQTASWRQSVDALSSQCRQPIQNNVGCQQSGAMLVLVLMTSLCHIRPLTPTFTGRLHGRQMAAVLALTFQRQIQHATAGNTARHTVIRQTLLHGDGKAPSFGFTRAPE